MYKPALTILMVFAIFAVQLNADECGESPCQDTSQLMGSYRCLIHKTAVVDKDGRRTEEEYAGDKVKPLPAVQNRFAPTGILKCNGSELSAQLTGATGVITTAGHGFIDTKTCQKISTPETCTFKVKIGTEERTSRVTKMVGTGIVCPDLTEAMDDWAVLKIDPPLDGITPYELPDKLEIKAGMDVIAVSAMARDFVRVDPKTKKRYLPKSIEECETKRVVGVQGPAVIESNCDFGKGNSGGSLIKVVSGRDVLMGISIANRESEAQLRKAERSGKPNAGPYKQDEWTTYHVPLFGTFLDTVKKAVGEQSI